MSQDYENLLTEYCDPFDEKYNYYMRVEHLGRYLYVKDNIDKNSNVLDIACANGYGTRLLSDYCKKIVGIDINKEYIKIAKEKYNNKNIIYKVLDSDFEEIDGVYDYIVCFETLEHVKFPELLLKKLYKALSKNGKLFLSVPNFKYEVIENGENKDIYHLHIFKYNELIDMFNENGFKVLKVLGQSMPNKIVNKIVNEGSKKNINIDAMDIGYPNEKDIDLTYSYIFVLDKGGRSNL